MELKLTQLAGRRLLLSLIITATALVLVTPVGFLVFGSFWSTSPGIPGAITTSNYSQVLSDPSTAGAVFTSVVYSIGSALLATAGGFIIAFLVHRTDAPFRRLMTITILVTLAIPFFVEDISWGYLLNPTNGLFNIWFRQLTGFPIFDIYSIWGLILVMGVDLIPLSYLTIAASLSLMDPLLEETSRIAGAGLRTTMRRIVVPLARPAILSTMLLDFIISMEAFDAPAIIGVPGRVYVLTTSIYKSIVGVVPPDYGVATTYAVLLILITMSALALYLRFTQRANRFVTVTTRAGRPNLIALGKVRWAAGAFFVAYILLYPLPILGTIVLASLHPFWNPGFLLSGFTLSNFSAFLSLGNTSTSLSNSLIVGISSAAIAVLLAFAFGYARTRSTSPGARLAEVAVTIPLALPTLVLGLGLLWSLVSSPVALYGTIWALTLAYVIRYIPVVMRLLAGPLIQIQKDFEEVSRICGASFLRTIRSIVLPMMKPALVISLIYVFLVSIKDLGAAVLLVTSNSQVLSAVIFQFWSTGEFGIADAAGVLYIIILSAVLVVAIFAFKANPTSLVSPEGERLKGSNLSEERPGQA